MPAMASPVRNSIFGCLLGMLATSLVLAENPKTPSVSPARIATVHPLRGLRPIPHVVDHHRDSSIWTHPDFVLRKGDIIVATSGKSGTTWTQQIAVQILNDGHQMLGPGHRYKRLYRLSPWVEVQPFPNFIKAWLLEALPGRRVLKTHLSLEQLPYSPDVTYLAPQRDMRDAAVSMWEHWNNQTWVARLVFHGMGAPPRLFEQFWRGWIKDGRPFWSPWDHVVAGWKMRQLPNVELMHYGEMKRDLPKVVERVAATAGVELDAAAFARVLNHVSFDYMKRDGGKRFSPPPLIFKRGKFINKGKKGRFKEHVTPAMLDQYRRARDAGLAPLGSERQEVIEWLERKWAAPTPS